MIFHNNNEKYFKDLEKTANELAKLGAQFFFKTDKTVQTDRNNDCWCNKKFKTFDEKLLKKYALKSEEPLVKTENLENMEDLEKLMQKLFPRLKTNGKSPKKKLKNDIKLKSDISKKRKSRRKGKKTVAKPPKSNLGNCQWEKSWANGLNPPACDCLKCIFAPCSKDFLLMGAITDTKFLNKEAFVNEKKLTPTCTCLDCSLLANIKKLTDYKEPILPPINRVYQVYNNCCSCKKDTNKQPLPCDCKTCECDPCLDPNKKKTKPCNCKTCKCDPCADPNVKKPCDCETCECDPCSDPNVKKTIPCNCKTCKCDPCKDKKVQENKNKVCTCCDPCKCDPCSDPNKSYKCTCDACECESCKDPNVKGKGKGCNCDVCKCEDCSDPNAKKANEPCNCQVCQCPKKHLLQKK